MTFRKKILFFWAILYVLITNVEAQDIQFSQFYAASTYLNPAFAGSMHQTRVTFHQRLQWPALDARYNTTFFSADHYFSKYKSGVGLYVLRDVQGKNILGTREVALQYSFEVGLSSKLAFRPGLQAGIINRTLDYSHLYYPDQLDDQGLTGQNTQDPHYSSYNAKTFVDFGAGGILYSDRFWISYAGSHLERPNQTFWGGDVSVLPVKHSFTGGYRIYLKKGETKAHMGHQSSSLILIPTGQFKFQGKSDQVDLGAYVLYDVLITGVWYRGIPFKKYLPNLQNNESLIALIGWKYKDFRISYSYDFVVSKLQVARTGGAHELNLTYIFGNKKKVRHYKILPCPEN